tara:strand:+ start:989 stop:1207 length:219 start_codon:yes stop_codon:yes gene_type:complete
MSIKEEKAWLTDNCQRLNRRSGICKNPTCLVRGGEIRKEAAQGKGIIRRRINYKKATCEAFEIYQRLRKCFV